jgi:2'-5' RNA ligase
MSRDEPEEPKARLFIALDLPEKVRDGVVAWQGKALADPALRPMRAEALHITMCFLAQRAEREIPRIEAVMRSLEPRPIELRFEPEPMAVPKGRPRLFTLGATSDSAVALQEELSQALAAERLYEPEDRHFWPHVTVARVRTERLAPERGQRRGKARPKRLRKAPARLPKALEQPFDAVRLVLYRSNLKPQGAEYDALSGIDLPSLRTRRGELSG